MLHFVDRKKNIIRRSGENIAAAEVEALLLTHPDVHQVAVMPVKDELREEEVLACVVLRNAAPGKEMAETLFQYCLDWIAYYKAPGWIHFVPTSSTTGTQKIQKHNIYPKGTDPRSVAGLGHPPPEAAPKGMTLSCMPLAPIVERTRQERPGEVNAALIDFIRCLPSGQCRPIGRACRSGSNHRQDWKKLERAKGFEPSTPTLARSCSTPELRPRSDPAG